MTDNGLEDDVSCIFWYQYISGKLHRLTVEAWKKRSRENYHIDLMSHETVSDHHLTLELNSIQ